jgi:PTS system nitrogen regulatory IIA component
MEEDFDIDGLAAYLHLMPAQISRLADRGKLPGRRVGGAWRFSRPEIHLWLEERIGLSDEQELVEMEGVLDRSSGPAGDAPIRIADLLSAEAIRVPFDARTQSSVISRMTALAAETGLLWDPEKMADAVRARESMQTTAIGNGVALLHPRRPMPSILGEAILALGITPQGIPFGGGGSLTDIYFLICSTSDHEHLRILARLSRMIGDPRFLDALREATDASEVLRMIRERDEEFD